MMVLRSLKKLQFVKAYSTPSCLPGKKTNSGRRIRDGDHRLRTMISYSRRIQASTATLTHPRAAKVTSRPKLTKQARLGWVSALQPVERLSKSSSGTSTQNLPQSVSSSNLVWILTWKSWVVPTTMCFHRHRTHGRKPHMVHQSPTLSTMTMDQLALPATLTMSTQLRRRARDRILRKGAKDLHWTMVAMKQKELLSLQRTLTVRIRCTWTNLNALHTPRWDLKLKWMLRWPRRKTAWLATISKTALIIATFNQNRRGVDRMATTLTMTPIATRKSALRHLNEEICRRLGIREASHYTKRRHRSQRKSQIKTKVA